MKHAKFVAVCLVGGLLGCKSGLEPDESPLLSLANRLYLEGEWAWFDSTEYRSFQPQGDTIAHHGSYVFSGTATIEALDSVDVEGYLVSAVVRLDHVDSTVHGETVRWYQEGLDYADTVLVLGDTIFGLSLAPIPPDANPNTDRIRWWFGPEQLWCHNWLGEVSGATECSTIVSWIRTAKAGGEANPTGTGI